MTENEKEYIETKLRQGHTWKYMWTNSFDATDFPSPSALRKAYRRATGEYKDKRRRHDLKVDVQKTHTESLKEEKSINKDGTRTSEMTTNEPLDLNDERALLLYHHYDPEKWQIEWSKGSKWDAIGRKGEEARTFYSSRVTVRPREVLDTASIPEMLKDAKPIAIPIVKTKEGKRILELSLADIHIGRLAWKGTAGEDYDTKLAIERIRKVMGRVVERIGDEIFDTIIVPVGGDLVNQEFTGATTSGTPQDTDSRYPRVFRDTMYLVASVIEEMRKHARTVKAIHISGNHDASVSVSLAYAMEAWFRNCNDVEVDCSAVKRKYLEFSNCLLCIGHLAEDSKNLPNIFPSEAASAWGRTKYREAHGQHLHKESVVDFPGFTLRRSPSIVSNDEWSHSKGFGCLQRHTTYIWDADNGLSETWYDQA